MENNKKVFVPTKEELYKMQKFGVNIYNYLTCKAIDTLVLENERGSILKDKHIYNQDIIECICKMYPEEIKNAYHSYYWNFNRVTDYILKKSQDTSVTNIDKLSDIEKMDLPLNSIQDINILYSTISILAEKLPLKPEYRYEYQKPNIWLDTIFSGNLIEWLNERHHNWCTMDYETRKDLCKIEPYYALNNHLDYGEDILLTNGSIAYFARYDLTPHFNPEYRNNCDLDKPDKKVKTLARIINKTDNFN